MARKPSKPTCLLIITGAFQLGGGVAAANRLVIHALVEAGYQARIFAFGERPDAHNRYIQLPNVEFRAFSSNKIAFTLAVWHALLSSRYALVFCDHVNLGAILMPLSAVGLIRYTVRINGIEVFEPLPNWEGRLGLRAARQRLAISDFTQQQVNRRFTDMAIDICDLALDPGYGVISDDGLTGEPPPITLTAISGCARSLGEHMILHVGRMNPAEQYKGQDTLIAAMAQVLDRHPDTQLVLAGDGCDAARLKTLARAQPAPARDAIFMPGFVPNDLLDRLYQRAYLFAMPSRGEGFGLVYLEAMRWARPCIGSRVDASQCVIEDGKTGLLADDPSDPDTVAQLVLWLLDHPQEAQAMGRAGFERLRTHYLFPQFKERFLNLLDLS